LNWSSARKKPALRGSRLDIRVYNFSVALRRF
jgi:hypothetical protein